MNNTTSFTVTLDLPHGVDRARMCEYIREAVAANIGMLPPEDPLFHLDRKSVRVAHVPRQRTTISDRTTTTWQT